MYTGNLKIRIETSKKKMAVLHSEHERDSLIFVNLRPEVDDRE